MPLTKSHQCNKIKMGLQQEKGEVCEAEEPPHRIIVKDVTLQMHSISY